MSSKERGKEGSEADNGVERRSAERIDVTWSVDCETDDTFLYASIANISELGIFVMTREPLRGRDVPYAAIFPSRSPCLRVAWHCAMGKCRSRIGRMSQSGNGSSIC